MTFQFSVSHFLVFQLISHWAFGSPYFIFRYLRIFRAPDHLATFEREWRPKSMATSSSNVTQSSRFPKNLFVFSTILLIPKKSIKELFVNDVGLGVSAQFSSSNRSFRPLQYNNHHFFPQPAAILAFGSICFYWQHSKVNQWMTIRRAEVTDKPSSAVRVLSYCTMQYRITVASHLCIWKSNYRMEI